MKLNTLARRTLARLHSSSATRKFFESVGVHVLPANFYSGSPTLGDIEKSWEREASHPYLNTFAYEDTEVKRELGELPSFTKDFDFPLSDDTENPKTYFFKNSQFSHSDAMLYYAMIRKHKPHRILEIGSGFSTLLALEAVRRNNVGRISCVEPFPRLFLRNLDIDLIESAIQSQDVERLIGLLGDGDILFIDSTHTVKAGSDCLWIYLKFLPLLIRSGKRVYVHVHDIFWPNSMPDSFTIGMNLNWTEQYLLMALLSGNERTRFLFSSEYARIFCAEDLRSLANGYPSQMGGGSFWFQIN